MADALILLLAWAHALPWLLTSVSLRLRLAYLTPLWHYGRTMARWADRRMHVLGLRESTQNLVRQRERQAQIRRKGKTLRRQVRRDWLV